MVSTELTKYRLKEEAKVKDRRQVTVNSENYCEHSGMRCLGEIKW